ncbi:SCO family protein [soil metagenome]
MVDHLTSRSNDVQQPHPTGQIADRWTRRRVLGLGALAAGALLTGCGSSGDGAAGDPEPGSGGEGTDWTGTLLDPPFEKPDVTFTDFDGQPFPFLGSTKGNLTILFFGFTNCPDICPVYLSTMARALEAIGEGPGSAPQVLFVGVDVKRDTPEALKTYLGNIDETFIGLTGEESEIARAITAVKLPPVEIGPADAEGNYEVGHPARVIAFSSDDLSHRLYTFDVTVDQWAKDLPRLARGQWK